MKILVTGAAGFIGFYTAQQLLARGDEVIGMRIPSQVGRSFRRMSVVDSEIIRSV